MGVGSLDWRPGAQLIRPLRRPARRQVPGISALPYALRYVDRHARDEGGPDCAQIFKILMRGSPVPASLERPKPKSKKAPGAARDDDVL